MINNEGADILTMAEMAHFFISIRIHNSEFRILIFFIDRKGNSYYPVMPGQEKMCLSPFIQHERKYILSKARENVHYSKTPSHRKMNRCHWLYFLQEGQYLGRGSFRATVAPVFVGDLRHTNLSYWRCFPHPTRSFYFSVHLDYLWWNLRPLIINNCNARIVPTKSTQPFVHIAFKTQLVQNRYAADKNGTKCIRRGYASYSTHISNIRSTYTLIRRTYESEIHVRIQMCH